MTDTTEKTYWSRLQALSCYHAADIYSKRTARYCRRGTSVPEDIAENCEILGRGDEEEIKARVLWYLDVFPKVFTAVSENGWREKTDRA